MEFDKETLEVFLKEQYRVFPQPVVESMRETQEFLEQNMAVVVDSIQDVRNYFEENGLDISGMSDDELVTQSEVFPLKKSGRYLIVEI